MEETTVKYKRESFLEVIVENYSDYIKNMVYKFQKYEDILKTVAPEIYTKPFKKDDSEETIKITAFILTEADNIYRMKGISFIRECKDVLASKYKMLRSGIKSTGSGAKYYFSQEAFQFFMDHIDQINWSVITNDVYSNGHIIEESFTELMEEMFMAYSFHEFKQEPSIYYCEPVVVMLDKCFDNLIETLTKLKTLAEESRSSHLTTIIAREALDIMIMVYSSIKTIKLIDSGDKKEEK